VLVVDGTEWRTILMPSYRAQALNDRDPRIRLGFELAHVALRTIADRCRETNVRILVLLLPTKENVFFPHAKMAGSDRSLETLVANEERLKRECIEGLESRRIAYVDLLQPLRSAPAQPYFEDVDAHLNPAGHRIVAAQVAAWLNRPRVGTD